MKRKTKEEFISDAIKIHGDKYDYSKIKYVNTTTKVLINCKKHGDFLQAPSKHLVGQGCLECKGRHKLTKQSFIKRAIEKHKDKYNYSKVKFVSSKEKVVIVCNKHGDFPQLMQNHLKGAGCPKCGRIEANETQRYTVNQFIEIADEIHNHCYDYSEVNYFNSQTKVKIICPKHGSFLMKPNNHQVGQGCPKCGRIKANENMSVGFEVFTKRAKQFHGETYEYDKSSYINYTSKIRMRCSEHGWFEQTPHSHISMNTGCPICGINKRTEVITSNWEDVLELFKLTHGDKFKYNEKDYRNATTLMKITCPKHGVFKQRPYSHYGGNGCPDCSNEEVHEAQKINFSQFKEKSILKHGNRYSYSEADFRDIFTPIEIKCSSHGFFIQVPREHYRGSGCPKCISSRGENEIRVILENNNIKFLEQKKFKGLIYKTHLKCDFYLPKYNIVIEFNGQQHYSPIKLFGGDYGFEQTKRRDEIKRRFLKEKSIPLLEIKYDESEIEKLIFSFLKLIK